MRIGNRPMAGEIRQLLNYDPTSGVKGVSWRAERNLWVARIHLSGKTQHLGCFRELEDAKAAYEKAAASFHGKFAVHSSTT